MDVLELIRRIEAEGLIDRIANDPAGQFGLRPEQFFLASVLPERVVEGNIIEDESLRYRSIIANDAARYSPVQLKESAAMFGSMLAKLAESDVGKEYTAQMYDRLRDLINRGGPMQAQANFLGWLDQEVVQALQRKNELYRAQAIGDGVVIRIGDNGYTETVAYPSPPGNRRTVATNWGDPNVDPFDDIFGLQEDALMAGIRIGRIIMSSKTGFTLARSPKVQDRAGNYTILPDGTRLSTSPQLPSSVTAAFLASGLPAPEVYDGVYHDAATGTNRYLHEDKMVFLGATGRTEIIEPEEGDPFYVEDTLGYLAVGRSAGQDAPGRVLSVEVVPRKKPPRIEVEGYQTTLPIIQSPEHIYVLDVTL